MSLSAHSAGGDLGQRLAGNPIGVLVWLVAGVAAFSLAFPQMAAAAVQNSPDAARRVWGWQHPAALGAKCAHGLRVHLPDAASAEGLREGAARFGDVGADVRRRGRRRRRCGRGRRRARAGVALPGAGRRRGGRAGRHDGRPRQPPLARRLAAACDGRAEGQGAGAERYRRQRAAGRADRRDARELRRRREGRADQRGADCHAVRHRARAGRSRRATSSSATRTTSRSSTANGMQKTRTEEVSRTRVRVQQITSLANDMALALAAPSIRIEAPVPGQAGAWHRGAEHEQVAGDAAERRRERRRFRRRHRRARSRWRWARASRASRSSPTWRGCRTC